MAADVVEDVGPGPVVVEMAEMIDDPAQRAIDRRPYAIMKGARRAGVAGAHGGEQLAVVAATIRRRGVRLRLTRDQPEPHGAAGGSRDHPAAPYREAVGIRQPS